MVRSRPREFEEFAREIGNSSITLDSIEVVGLTDCDLHSSTARPLATRLLFKSASDAWGRRHLVSALLNTLLRSHAEVQFMRSANDVAHGLQFRSQGEVMKLRALVLIFALALAANGLAQDVATDVPKGVKDAGKAAETTSKDAARATKSAAKDAAHATDKVATDTAKGTEKASKKTAWAGERAGKKAGKEIGKGAEDAGKGMKKAATKTADAVK